MKLQYSPMHPLTNALKVNLIFAMVLLFLTGRVTAQQLSKDHSGTALKNAIHYYDQEIARNSMIYTGPGYIGNYGGMKGHQYFVDNYWETGSVTYAGSPYDSIDLMYDVYQDQLLIENFNSKGYLSPIRLYGPEVNSFTLFGYYFEWIDADTTSGFKPGYYNVMFQDKGLRLLVKRKKEVTTSDEIGVIREMFVESDRYFIWKDGGYHQVRRKRSVLKLLPDHKKELKRFIHDHRLTFRHQADVYLTKVVKYYSTLM